MLFRSLLLELSQNNQWEALDFAVKTLQDMTQRIRFSPGPVVAAPFQLTLGGGVELVQPAAHRIAAAETYMGLVEVGVGLIPGGGGNLRMILNAMEGGTGRMGAFQKIQKTFETVGFAKIATSADEAKHLGYLKKDEIIYPSLKLKNNVKAKHKFSIENLSIGDSVFMYGVVVGKAKKRILKGEQISPFNIVHETEDYKIPKKVSKTKWNPPRLDEISKKTFLEIGRAHV